MQLSPADRQTVVDALLWLQGRDRILLHGFVVMPDHFHVLMSIRPGHQLPKVMHSLKSYTASAINRSRTGEGKVWQEGYRDDARLTDEAFLALKTYVEENPVRAGVVSVSHEYRWSSANDDYRTIVDPIM